MMNGSYYKNHSRSVPVHKPKVVSIPVHFISSDHHQPETNKHSSAALKIQKVFKGHTVRKALNKIVSIKNQVNDIEERLQSDDVFVRTLRNDAKERLRVNETLMSLLFKLDSVRGVGNGVRDVRKSVAKKAIALQEKVDSIAQTFEEADDDGSNEDKTEIRDVRNGIGNEVNEEDAKEEDVVDDDVSNGEKAELCDVSNSKVNEDVVDDNVSKNDQNSGSVEDQELVVNKVMNEDSMKQCDDYVNNNNVRNQESVENEENVKQGVENRVTDDDGSMKECDDDDVSKSCGDHETDRNDDVSKRCCDKGMVAVMEKLMSDNAKMMKLMKQISERNEMQTRMINSLSKRVEQLEKAFIMTDNKSRRRKKSYTRREKDSFCI